MTRHPSEATLLAHAAGHLPPTHSVVLRAHMAQCPHCRAQATLAREAGGALLAELAPAAMAPDALARAFAGLDGATPLPPPRPAPRTLAELATGRWWWIAPGMRLMPLQRRGTDDARLDLIRVAPGMKLPAHGHTGTELTLVLQGAFGDETGEYHAGDVAEGDPELDHQPEALPMGQDCICLISTTGRLRAHGWLARLVQPLVGV